MELEEELGEDAHEPPTIESEQEEEITDTDLSAIIDRLDALTARITELEGILAELTNRLGGYDGRFAEYDARFRREEPSERHWYFRRITPEIA